jgi:hypothetical protein
MPTAAQQSPIDALNLAVAGRLYQAVTVDGVTIPVYESAAEKTPLRYLTFGPATSATGECDSASDYGRDLMLPVDSWSQRGSYDANYIIGQVPALLIDPTDPLALAGDIHALIQITLEDDDAAFLDADGRTWHAHQLYRVLIQQL